MTRGSKAPSTPDADHVPDELGEMQDEAAEYARRAREAEAGRAMAVRELGGAASATDDLRRSVEAERSAGPGAELDGVRRRHAAALEDLRSAREQLQRERASPRNAAVEELAGELAALREQLDASRAARDAAEEKRMGVALAAEREKAQWQAELETREDEARKLGDEVAEARDLEFKVAAAFERRAALRAVLEGPHQKETRKLRGVSIASRNLESKVASAFARLASLRAKLVIIPAVEETMDAVEEDEPTASSQAALREAKEELEEVKASVGKARGEAKVLCFAAARLRADIDKEKAKLAALRRDKRVSSASSVASLQEEARAKHGGGEESTTRTMPERVKEARRLAEQATRTAQEEVAKAKAAADAMEARLEVLAADATATASADTLLLQEISEPLAGGGVALTAEEYGKLSLRAAEAEELAGKRVTEAAMLINEANDAVARSLDNLVQAAKKAEQRRQALQVATRRAEEAELGKLAAERELRLLKDEHERRRRFGGASSSPPRALHDLLGNQHILSPREREGYTKRKTESTDTVVIKPDEEEEEGKHRKIFFFPRIMMFLARKKAQGWHSK